MIGARTARMWIALAGAALAGAGGCVSSTPEAVAEAAAGSANEGAANEGATNEGDPMRLPRLVAASVQLPGASLSPTATRYDYALVDGVGEASAGLEIALAGNTVALELAPHSVTVLGLAPSR